MVALAYLWQNVCGRLVRLMKIAAMYFFFLCLLPVSAAPIRAQEVAAPAPLLTTIRALDTSLFDAYNRCDLAKLGTLVADDLEFYHDQTGLSVGKAIFLENTKKYICGKVRRELVAGSMEVYPLKTYGAVEMGTHRFYHPGREQEEAVGEAKFVLLWQNRNGVWKLARVISYDHGAMAK